MNKALGIFATVIFGGQLCLAADVFVRDAKGSDLSQQQVSQVTDHVRRAVQNMPEHSVASSEEQADIVLVPTIVNRGDMMVLRIDKTQNGEVVSSAEEPIRSTADASTNIDSLARTSLQDDQMGSSASAMSSAADTEEMSDPSMSESASDDSSMSGSSGEMASGDVRSPSPMIANPNRLGYFQLGAGPAFALGLDTDKIMYNIHGSYNVDFREDIVGKVFGDANLSTGGSPARFINTGVGAEWYPQMAAMQAGKPYIQGDVGFAFTRHDDTQQRDALALGAGAGFKFAAAELNLDVNLHYTILTSQINEDTPSVLGLRVAVNF